MDKKPITPEGQKKLREELDFIKNVKRQEIIDAISEARAHGDLKENAEYHAAREEQGLNEARIRELEDVLSRSQVIEYLDLGVEDRVIFGSTVTINDLDSDKTNTYQIVGESEANIEMNTISFTTPIAKALLKKEVGDVVEVETPGGIKEVEIVDIKLV
ncbi:MAG: transcription elongation factor GreA [SAR86 cluster bacterium]|uniref:Transcription elongation factor GreA n=1 Tax=SAR86 cluster bacterium TaxID=2030880 RepID=A0A368BN14_9GAMM|nr:MAG: transcription elongation factor GreA [Gammaproteobacteria bacterium TMED219]RCL38680.1 MAG: transcription elongation factor GreA [SAR86 cluster bacterium]|tara:strand:+ start:17196 stop:17672 length:477 start_codon:yes stop_codon:yes gene_type:complete